jgi:DNA recombination protein RmuC
MEFSLLMAFAAGLALGLLVMAIVLFLQKGQSARLRTEFENLASAALANNHQTFLNLANAHLAQTEKSALLEMDKKTLAVDASLKPIQTYLEKMQEYLSAIELKREGSYRELVQRLQQTNEMHSALRDQTHNLTLALKSPQIRGRWGEVQLERLLDLTGMRAYAGDYTAQASRRNDDITVRPDMVLHLPGGRKMIIDSKTPLNHYLAALETSDTTERTTLFQQHAKSVKTHIKSLAGKSYWQEFENSLDFVVMFMPGEQFLFAALEHEPDLLEYAFDHHVTITTPATLMALLKAFAYSWRQEGLADNARKIADLGADLYRDLARMTESFRKLGDNLKNAAENYNTAIGTIEGRLFPRAKKLQELGAVAHDATLSDLKALEKPVRGLISEGWDETASPKKDDAA